MDKMLSPFILTVCMILIVGCTVPQWACAQESTPTAQADNSPRKVAREQQTEKNKTSVKAKKREAKQKEKAKGIHAPAWAFGSGAKSRDAWREGTTSKDLRKRAVGDNPAGDKAVNTTESINSSLEGTQVKNEHKSGMGLSVKQDDSAWRPKNLHEMEADENLPMQSRHVLRAYADVDAGDDLSIMVGPELILKDEQRERTSANKQPDSALGLGMQFKLDF